MSLFIGILDDDRNILQTFRAMATVQDWQVLASARLEDAEKWFASEQIDLLLLDYHMPECNGREALKRLKAVNPSIPVLMLTVELDAALANELLVEGADDFINKPLRLADFVARIRLHEKLSGRRDGGGWRKSDKGISAATRKRVVKALQALRAPATIREVAVAAGLAYPTAHRYLDCLFRQKVINRTENAEAGKQGRPVVRYFPLGAGADGMGAG
jgi:DNA-binding response OmpR family regulator